MNIPFTKRLIALMQQRADDPTDPTLPSFNMEMWLEKEENEHSCGTVGCIAGWATLLAHPNAPVEELSKLSTARRLLGISYEEASRLFYGHWSNKPRSKITIQDAITHLQHLVNQEELPHA